MTHQETFIQIYQEHIHRRGADQLLAWLQSDASDFFTAPSSTRYHGSYEGGLVEHSLNVYHCLVDYLARPRTKELYGMDYSDETVALVALMHDICKVNFYVVDYRNAKNEQGVWENAIWTRGKIRLYAVGLSAAESGRGICDSVSYGLFWSRRP